MEQGAEMVVYRKEIKDQANLVAKEQLVFFSVSYLLTVWNCSSWLPRRKRTVEREQEASCGPAFLLNMPLLGGCGGQDACGPDDP